MIIQVVGAPLCGKSFYIKEYIRQSEKEILHLSHSNYDNTTPFLHDILKESESMHVIAESVYGLQILNHLAQAKKNIRLKASLDRMRLNQAQEGSTFTKKEIKDIESNTIQCDYTLYSLSQYNFNTLIDRILNNASIC